MVRPRPTESSTPGKRAARLLHALSWVQFLTSMQATRLLFGNSYATTTEAFKELMSNDYVHVVRHRGTNVHFLSKKGIRYLASHGIHSYENTIEDLSFLPHTLKISDFLISASLLSKQAPQFRLSHVAHERVLNEELRNNPQNKVTIAAKGKSGAVIPKVVSPILDAFLVLESDTATYPIGLEIDMGTESEQQWREKVRALTTWEAGPYRKPFFVWHTHLCHRDHQQTGATCDLADLDSNRTHPPWPIKLR